VPDLLLEIGTEDLPPAEIAPVVDQLGEGARAALADLRLDADGIQTYGTPRRLVLFVEGVAAKQRPAVREVRGPAAAVAYDAENRPTVAATGFARSQGVAVERLQVREVGGRRYAVAVLEEAGRPASRVLPDALKQVVDGLTFPRAMRWGSGDVRFIRPVRWVAALLGTQVLRITIAGVTAGRKTFGHRFLAPRGRTIARAAGYFPNMKAAHVVLVPDERRDAIVAQARALAAKAGGIPQLDAALLDETVMSVEHPQVLLGAFDTEFLVLPPPVLVTVMEHHQKYFPVIGPDGALKPSFLAVRDGDRAHLGIVREGHQWVLRARLADARFFFDEDRKHRLEDFAPRLEGLVLLTQLGTMAGKTRRLLRLAEYASVALVLDGTTTEALKRAAQLCKADLVTHMVGEFPELQGVIGGIYASLDGEPNAVARAIGEHYLPARAGDRMPSTQTGALLAVLDRTDTLVGALAAGLAPTGSQDPYALRRVGQGLVEIVLAHGVPLPLSGLLEAAAAGFDVSNDGVIADAVEFLRQRLRAALSERGIRYDVVDAALAVSADDVLGGARRAEAIEKFLTDPAFPKLFVAYDRATRILDGSPAGAVDPALFEHEAERTLALAVGAAAPVVAASAEAGDLTAALRALVPLAGPVDRLFDAVLVMAPDPRVRANRQALLGEVVRLFRTVGDFSKIVMEGRDSGTKGPGD
jgi:glycyl-tRNA synthetase beta chain